MFGGLVAVRRRPNSTDRDVRRMHPLTVSNSGAVTVYATLSSEEVLGTIEARGARFSVAFADEGPQPFDFETFEVALRYFEEFAWSRNLGRLH